MGGIIIMGCYTRLAGAKIEKRYNDMHGSKASKKLKSIMSKIIWVKGVRKSGVDCKLGDNDLPETNA